MTLPTIHRNGTSAKDLKAGYDAAAEALEAFADTFGNIEFNSRDYYVQGSEAWTKAIEERYAIHTKVKEIAIYLQTIREHLYAND